MAASGSPGGAQVPGGAKDGDLPPRIGKNDIEWP